MKITKDTPEEKILELGKKCDMSGHCCNYTSGTVLKSEVAGLAKHFQMKEKEFIDKFLEEQEKYNTTHYRFKQTRKKPELPYGKCIFLKNNKCKIHHVKPLHCRAANCSDLGEELSLWFTLNHFVNPDDPESIRQWDIFLKTNNHSRIPGCTLEELIPDKEKRNKILNFEVLK